MWAMLRRLIRPDEGAAAEGEVREEMLTHLAFLTDEYRDAGLDERAARRAAERQFGDLDRLVRDGQAAKTSRQDPLGKFPNRRHRSPGSALMTDFLNDLRFGARMLTKSPTFSLVAILSLAIGIGFNATMFTVVNSVMFTPFPGEDSESVVRVRRVGNDFGDQLMSHPDFNDVRAGVESLSGVVSMRNEMVTFNNDGDVEFVFGESVSSDYFELLGIPPFLGRTFAPDEDIPGNHFVVMVSEKFWRDRLGADEGAIGRSYEFSGDPYTLIGVVPSAYTGLLPPLEASFWAPSVATLDLGPAFGDQSRLERRGSHGVYVLGRLAEGATIEQANAEVEGIAAELAQQFADTNEDKTFAVVPASDIRIDPQADAAMLPAAAVLMGLVGLVLLLACANVANMMLARASVRRQEIGVRMALGAGRSRLIRQLLTESLLLAGIGGVLAVLMARFAIQFLLAIQPPIMVPMSLAIDVSGRVWVFTALTALVTGLVFGLIPALRSTRADLSQSLRGDEAGDDGQLKGGRLRNALVVAQVTLSLVLLISASLMVRSLQNASSIDPGMATESVVSVSPGLAFQGYRPESARDFYLQALERIAALPGVDGVAYAERLPLEATMVTNRSYFREGSTSEEPDASNVMTTVVSPEYFDLMEIEIARGRQFTVTDVDEAPPVIIINDVLADQLWPGQNPLGKRLHISRVDGTTAEVVGIHAPHKVSTLGEEPTPNVYLPYAQDTGSGFGNLLARTDGDAGAVLTGMRGIIREMDASVAVLEVETIGEHLALSLFPVRLSAGALGLLGLVGALLAAVGVYGVVAFTVARRTREIGIRMAIGAERKHVLRMVLRQGMWLIGIGAAIGVVLSLGLTQALNAMLYGVSATDALAFVMALLALGAIGTAANLIPALRAAHVEPTSALKTD